MMKLLKIFSLFFCANLAGYATRAQSEWELQKAKDSIFIYTRVAEGSKFNELKVVFDLRGSLQQLRSIIQDVGHYQDWVYASKSSTVIEKKNDNELIYYSEVEAPWPLSNRDFYSDTKIWLDSANKQLRISSCNLANKYEEKKHLVRIPFLKAEWVASIITPLKIHIEYILHWDPGGSIPAWIANMFSTTGPYKSFAQLQKKMAGMNP